MRAKCPTRDRFQPAAASLFAMLLAAGVVSPSLAYQQAPSLDQAVETGELPPVDERLPAEPLVVEPVEQIGSYGGTWNSGLRGGGDGAWLSRTVAYEGLVRWDRNWENIIPNIATSWEVSDDGRAFTFRLREGVRWSDGSPFTAEDVAFSLELSQDLAFPGEVPPWMRNPDNPPSWEVLDDYTIVVRFEQSNGMFMQELANVGGRQINHYNKAYCSQFYPKYNPEAESIAQERGFSDWGLLMLNRCATAGEIERWQNPELPSLAPWVLVEPYSGNARAVVLERNPYYFKVDPEGNQLPYIDRLEMRISESIDELTLMAMNGEIDFQDRHIATVTNKPVFFDNQERGDYRFLTTIPSSSNTMVLQLNLNHDDPVLREIFNNKDFRIGLSHAINRQEIIDVVFTGQGEPYQMAPR
ncbi:MAG: ABC transporter substrate-binding protein, partial [Pseudomonadota bacterium]